MLAELREKSKQNETEKRSRSYIVRRALYYHRDTGAKENSKRKMLCLYRSPLHSTPQNIKCFDIIYVFIFPHHFNNNHNNLLFNNQLFFVPFLLFSMRMHAYTADETSSLFVCVFHEFIDIY